MTVLQRAGPCLVLAVAACSSGERTTEEACSDGVDPRVTTVLDFAAAPTLPSPGGLLVQAPSGTRLAFVDRSVPYEVLLFDSAGEYEGSLGERGEGPGQFDRIGAIAYDDEGALWVSAHSGRRLELFDPNLDLLESIRLDYSVSELVATSAGMAVAASGESMGYIGLLDRTGEIDVLWQDSVLPGSTFSSGVSDLAASADGSVFFAEPFEYSVWRASRDGTLTPVLDAEPDWFRAEYPRELLDAVPGINTAGSTIWDLAIVNDTLWVTSAVPSLNVPIDELQRLLEAPSSSGHEIREALLDFVVEGIDLSSGETVAGASRVSGVSYGPTEYRVASPERVEVLAMERRGEGSN